MFLVRGWSQISSDLSIGEGKRRSQFNESPLPRWSARGSRRFNCSIREESYSVEGNSGAGWQQMNYTEECFVELVLFFELVPHGAF